MFREHVLSVVRAIPPGSVMTYGEVARLAGYPGAARAVGTLMRHNHDPSVPCHRIVRSNGTIGEYNRGADQKAARLSQEGIHITCVDGSKNDHVHYHYSSR